MVNQKVQKSSSWTPQPQAKSSPFASPPIPSQAHAATPHDIENQVFRKNKHEVLELQIQAKFGTITPQGEERLTLLQAKRDALRRDRLKSIPDDSLLNIPNLFASRETPQPIQPKLKIEKVGDKQEADQVGAKKFVSQINAPQKSSAQGEIIQRMPTSPGQNQQGRSRPGQPSKNKAPLKAGGSRTGDKTSQVPSPQSGTSQTQTTNPFLQKYKPKVRDKSGALEYETVGYVEAGPSLPSAPQQPEDKIGYVINMAAVPGEETPGKVAQTYYEQGFDNKSEVVKRLGMVMGVNKYRSIDGRSHSLVANHMKQTGNPEFMVRVFGFTWELVEWVDTTTNTVADADIDTVSKDFKTDLQLNTQQQQEVLATEKSCLGQSTIPYGLIREKITASSQTKELVKTLDKYNKRVYIHLGDADALSLSAPENNSPSQQQNGDADAPSSSAPENQSSSQQQNDQNKPKSLFSRYDEILKDNQHPLMAIGGYDFRYKSDGGDLDSANPKEHLTYLANQLDIAARKAISSIVPEAVYPTEPNLVFLAQGPNNSDDLFGLNLFEDSGELKPDKSGELFGRGPREGRKFQKNLLEASKNQYDTNEIIYAPEASVATSSERFKLTEEKVAKQQEALNKGDAEFKKQIIQDVIRQTQSFLSSSTFDLEVLSSPTAKINRSPLKTSLLKEYTQRIETNILGFVNKATTSNKSPFKAPQQNEKVTIVTNIINAVEAELNDSKYQWIWDELGKVISELRALYKK